MGLFSKLKNVVTGGAADVVVETTEATLEEAFTVIVRATARNDEVKYKQVYLNVVGAEWAVVHEVQTHAGITSVEGDFETCNLAIEVDGPGTLPPNETREWRVEIELPEDSMPSIDGETIGHGWRLKAGLDTAGNDPDSGWVEFVVE